jgi:hypothetical protein
MRFAVLLAAACVTLAPCAAAAERAPPPAAASGYSTATTPIAVLLGDPAARAVLDSRLPGFSSNGQVEMVRGMTLQAIKPFAPGQFSDELLAKIDADLAKLPAKP